MALYLLQGSLRFPVKSKIMTAHNTQKHYQLVILQWLVITIIEFILFFPVLKNYFYYDDFIVLGNLIRISRW